MNTTDRFSGLTKVPEGPFAQILAAENGKLREGVAIPEGASVSETLAALDAADALGDVLTVFAYALPVRERIWWACLAARDLLPPGDEALTPSIRAAEAWVFKPNDENREKAMKASQTADPDDDTIHCARAVTTHDGMLGPGELADLEAPKGATSVAALMAAVTSLAQDPDLIDERKQLLVDRALDIARGGNGRLNGDADPGGKES